MALTSWFCHYEALEFLCSYRNFSWRCIYGIMFSVLQSFEIVLFFKVSFSFLKRASCFSLVHFSFQPPNTEITAQLQRKEFLPRHVCIGEQSLFLECFCLFWSLYPKVLSTEIKCLYWEVPRREYCFLSGREEGRVKIFLLEVSDQNLNLRAQHLSQG